MGAHERDDQRKTNQLYTHDVWSSDISLLKNSPIIDFAKNSTIQHLKDIHPKIKRAAFKYLKERSFEFE